MSRPSTMLAGHYLDTLASFPVFEPVPRAELEWLGARGDVRQPLALCRSDP